MNKSKRDRSVALNLLAALACLLVAAGIAFFPAQRASVAPALAEHTSVNAICELAAVRSYYHNVALYEKQPDTLFRYGIAQYGYKKMWLEYSGYVEIGIDASQVQIGTPGPDGVVDVYVPEPKLLNINADESSFSEPLTETGWLTKITGEDQSAAYAAAQSSMVEQAAADEVLMARAKSNVKLLLEQYIVNTGSKMGAKYTVNWLSKPN